MLTVNLQNTVCVRKCAVVFVKTCNFQHVFAAQGLFFVSHSERGSPNVNVQIVEGKWVPEIVALIPTELLL